ncbi:hypothetical protein GA0111570_11373 [Raineyella antarctica]|uniref:GTP-binding protein LepA n=1 Tax=Raineyella antarctica TaxID=1577474 RepID=A0A1G6HZ22_9ACTN|nr:GTP-binding protein LepA [Raineyella antarctica]SDB99549.1 hypothetical protein GA0111570_11373 [Raineyella antarctica]
MPKKEVTAQKIHDHVERLGELYPPIPLSSVDFTVRDPEVLRSRYGHVLNYLARVELEVDRNVLEILAVIPGVGENDRFFYQDVWQPQEIQHGLILDQLCLEVGLPPSTPSLHIGLAHYLLGALAHWAPIQDVSRMMFYLSGASTERQAVLAYNSFTAGLKELGEDAIAESVVHPIKRQEPGHFAFYRMSAERLAARMRPWQMWLVQQLRGYSYNLVGTNGEERYKRDIGGLLVTFGLDRDIEAYAREIGRLEARLVWANRNGMEFPPYILDRMNESVELYREKGLYSVPERFDLEGHAVPRRTAEPLRTAA